METPETEIQEDVRKASEAMTRLYDKHNDGPRLLYELVDQFPRTRGFPTRLVPPYPVDPEDD